jgi:hypothetical protein
MDASTTKEFGEERVREVAALVEEIKQHIAFVDRWRVAQEDAPDFFCRCSENWCGKYFSRIVSLLCDAFMDSLSSFSVVDMS